MTAPLYEIRKDDSGIFAVLVHDLKQDLELTVSGFKNHQQAVDWVNAQATRVRPEAK